MIVTPDLNKTFAAEDDSGEEATRPGEEEDEASKEERIAEIICYICGQTFNTESIE